LVLRSELASAQAEAKLFREVSESKVKDLEWKEHQLTEVQEQLKSVTSKALHLQAQMSDMVSKSVARAESETLKEAITQLQVAKKQLEDEKMELVHKIQVKKMANVFQLLYYCLSKPASVLQEVCWHCI
jgi:hypothetical protein